MVRWKEFGGTNIPGLIKDLKAHVTNSWGLTSRFAETVPSSWRDQDSLMIEWIETRSISTWSLVLSRMSRGPELEDASSERAMA